MKTIEQVLRECPKQDKAYVLMNGRWHRIAEHEVRAIQVSVCVGCLEPPRIKCSNGEELRWDKERPGRFLDFKTNLFRASTEQTRDLMRAEILNQELRRKDNEVVI